MNDKLYLDIGSNHNGSFHRAIKLIEEAGTLKKIISESFGKDMIAGVKFQVFKADKLYTDEFEDVARILKQFEVSVGMLPKFLETAKANNLEFGISIFDYETLDEINKLHKFLDDPDVYLKIASSNLLLTDFVRSVAEINASRKVKKPLHISTGNSSLSQIRDAVVTVKDCKSDMIVYHCQMKYPCETRQADLSKIHSISAEMNCVGIEEPFSRLAYSDHTKNCMTVLSALSIVNTVEMHFDREIGDGFETAMAIRDNKKTHVWKPSEIMKLAEYIRDVDSSLYADASVYVEDCPEVDYRADPSDGLRPMKEWRTR